MDPTGSKRQEPAAPAAMDPARCDPSLNQGHDTMQRRTNHGFPLLTCLPGLVGIMLAASLHAATFTVDLDLDLVDETPGDGQCNVGAAVPLGGPLCTLRAAVMEAEANGEADTIRITPGMLISLSLAGDGGAEVGDLDISTEIAILGFVGSTPPLNPALLPRIDAEAINDRHFDVLSGQLTLRGLRLSNGQALIGGALRVSGNSTSRADVEHSEFRFNSAESRGGAIHIAGSARLHVTDSQFFRNDAGNGGGAAVALVGGLTGGTSVIQRSSFVDNRDSSLGASITVISNAGLRLENSTLDGSLLRPPIAGLEARTGISLFSEASLVVRHATISNYSGDAVLLRDLDGNEHVRIAHSILQGDNSGCQASGTDLAAANVRITRSIVEGEVNCEEYYEGVMLPGTAELEPLNLDDLPRLTLSRRPAGPLANVVDAGLLPESVVVDPDFACIDEDQLGNPRPLDANLDEDSRCDLGAIEQPSPEPFVVDHFADDLADDLPGDGLCATVEQPGIGAVCTLRAAVTEANALPGLQHITFTPSDDPVVLTLPAVGPVGGALDITDTVAIDGNLTGGRPATFIDGQMSGERLFLIDAPELPVYLRNLNLSGGAAAGSGGALAVLSNSTLFLQRCVVSDNDALTGGGAAAVLGGWLHVRDCDFHGNNSDANLDSQVLINNSSFRNHLGVDAGGSPQPVIDIDPGVSLRTLNATFSGNQIAVQADNPASLVLQHNSLVGQINGGVIADLGATSQFWLGNSIVSAPDSDQFDCLINGAAGAQFFFIDHVIDSDGSCAQSASFIGLTTDPLLGPIERPFARISYHHPPSVAAENLSPALDVAFDDDCSFSPDQYDRVRPVDLVEVPDMNGPCDLGSVESSVFDRLFDDSFES
jgi:hypothetical protein